MVFNDFYMSIYRIYLTLHQNTDFVMKAQKINEVYFKFLIFFDSRSIPRDPQGPRPKGPFGPLGVQGALPKNDTRQSSDTRHAPNARHAPDVRDAPTAWPGLAGPGLCGNAGHSWLLNGHASYSCPPCGHAGQSWPLCGHVSPSCRPISLLGDHLPPRVKDLGLWGWMSY